MHIFATSNGKYRLNQNGAIAQGGTTKNHSKKMKTSEFQRIQRFSFCFNCAKHADLGISIVPNSWLFFEPLKKATI